MGSVTYQKFVKEDEKKLQQVEKWVNEVQENVKKLVNSPRFEDVAGLNEAVTLSLVEVIEAKKYTMDEVECLLNIVKANVIINMMYNEKMISDADVEVCVKKGAFNKKGECLFDKQQQEPAKSRMPLEMIAKMDQLQAAFEKAGLGNEIKTLFDAINKKANGIH